MVKKIFLSYASEDVTWIENFTAAKVFGNPLGGDVEFFNYMETANFGPINALLDEQIGKAAAVVLFLSGHYIEKKDTLFEFWASLDELTLRRLIFVPVMMDGAAIGWWNEQRASGRLDDLKSPDGSDYAFAKFIGDNGRREMIYSEGRYNDAPAGRIVDLAKLIKKRLGPDIPPLPLRITGREPGPEPDRGGSSSKPIVLLGHPFADMPGEVAGPRDQLRAELEAAGLPPEIWADKWYTQPQTYRTVAPALLDRNPVFVQPVGPGEASELVKNPAIERGRLKGVVDTVPHTAAKADQSKLFIWLPEGLLDERLNQTSPALPTIFSRQSPSALAERLREEVGTSRPVVPVIMLETLTKNGALRNRLQNEFAKVVEQEVTPAPENWVFDGDLRSTLLEDQIAAFEGDKVILAINDLDVGPATKMNEARQKFDTKLGAFKARVEKALAKAKRPNLKFFWSALVVRNQKYLPFVKYPAPQFSDWRLLTFVNTAPDDPDCSPEPTRSLMFRSYLHDWLRSPA